MRTLDNDNCDKEFYKDTGDCFIVGRYLGYLISAYVIDISDDRKVSVGVSSEDGKIVEIQDCSNFMEAYTWAIEKIEDLSSGTSSH